MKCPSIARFTSCILAGGIFSHVLHAESITGGSSNLPDRQNTVVTTLEEKSVFELTEKTRKMAL